jgi:hypothetical protein
VASQAPADAPVQPAGGWRRYRGLIAVIVVAVVVVVLAFAVGVTGLLANPVKSVNGDGTTTLQGTFEPYVCGAGSCEGYVQAGARSVFVRFPNGCPEPARASRVTVIGRAAPDLGSGAYRATGCATG